MVRKSSRNLNWSKSENIPSGPQTGSNSDDLQRLRSQVKTPSVDICRIEICLLGSGFFSALRRIHPERARRLLPLPRNATMSAAKGVCQIAAEQPSAIQLRPAYVRRGHTRRCLRQQRGTVPRVEARTTPHLKPSLKRCQTVCAIQKRFLARDKRIASSRLRGGTLILGPPIVAIPTGRTITISGPEHTDFDEATRSQPWPKENPVRLRAG